jgi:hypothetical protein
MPGGTPEGFAVDSFYPNESQNIAGGGTNWEARPRPHGAYSQPCCNGTPQEVTLRVSLQSTPLTLQAQTECFADGFPFFYTVTIADPSVMNGDYVLSLQQVARTVITYNTAYTVQNVATSGFFPPELPAVGQANVIYNRSWRQPCGFSFVTPRDFWVWNGTGYDQIGRITSSYSTCVNNSIVIVQEPPEATSGIIEYRDATVCYYAGEAAFNPPLPETCTYTPNTSLATCNGLPYRMAFRLERYPLLTTASNLPGISVDASQTQMVLSAEVMARFNPCFEPRMDVATLYSTPSQVPPFTGGLQSVGSAPNCSMSGATFTLPYGTATIL